MFREKNLLSIKMKNVYAFQSSDVFYILSNLISLSWRACQPCKHRKTLTSKEENAVQNSLNKARFL